MSRSRKRRKPKSLWPVWLALGLPVIAILVMLVLAFLPREDEASAFDAEEAVDPAEEDVGATRRLDEAIIRLLAQQHVRFLANYPMLARFSEEDAIWFDPETGHVVYAGYLTDSIRNGEPEPRITEFFAVGLLLEASLRDGTLSGERSLLDLAEVIQFTRGDTAETTGDWPGGQSAWESRLASMQTQLDAAPTR